MFIVITIIKINYGVTGSKNLSCNLYLDSYYTKTEMNVTRILPVTFALVLIAHRYPE